MSKHKPLMPKATAVWLIENTGLTFEQIGEFCGLHHLEIQAIADGEVAGRMHGLNPVLGGQLTKDEIERCEKDSRARLNKTKSDLPKAKLRSKGPKYTPISKRQDKPDAIMWILKNHAELTDSQIVRLIGTTKNTIDKIRNREHWNMANIKAQHPVALGLCSQGDLEATIARAQRKQEKEQKAAGKPAAVKEETVSEDLQEAKEA